MSEDARADDMSYDEWVEATRTIREWVKGGTVSSSRLAKELAFWANRESWILPREAHSD